MNSEQKNPTQNPSQDSNQDSNHENRKEPSITSESSLVLPGRVIESLELLQGQRQVWIQHGEEMYRLQLTSNDKLYLTK